MYQTFFSTTQYIFVGKKTAKDLRWKNLTQFVAVVNNMSSCKLQVES